MTLEQALQLALTQHEAGNLAEAERIYGEILRQAPNQPDALHLLGLVRAATGRLDEALELVTRAVAIAPGHAVYRSNLGEVYRRLGRLEEAIQSLQTALTLQPGLADAHLNLGEAFSDAGRFDEAMASARNALALRPEWAAAHNSLGRAVAGKGKQEKRMPSPTRRLHYAGLAREGYGWGVCNMELMRALSKHVEVVGPEALGPAARHFDGPVFMPLMNHDFDATSPVRGTNNYAYTFFESPLQPNAPANAARYATVFCGSTWCLDRMREKGIPNGQVLVQGVDHAIFHPAANIRRPAGDELRIFSGGKFEMRKGQDIVIGAFRELVKRHPEAKLVCAWHNPWPDLLSGASQSPHIAMAYGNFADQTQFYRELLRRNEIPEKNFEVLPTLRHADLAAIMRGTDFGIFPNRCEGGTNLVLMEYMACGKTVVASGATGHADVLAPEHAVVLPPHLTAWHWDEPVIGEIVGAMEMLLGNAAQREKLGAAAGEAMKPWTWERSARTILGTVFPEEQW